MRDCEETEGKKMEKPYTFFVKYSFSNTVLLRSARYFPLTSRYSYKSGINLLIKFSQQESELVYFCKMSDKVPSHLITS